MMAAHSDNDEMDECPNYNIGVLYLLKAHDFIKTEEFLLRQQETMSTPDRLEDGSEILRPRRGSCDLSRKSIPTPDFAEEAPAHPVVNHDLEGALLDPLNRDLRKYLCI